MSTTDDKTSSTSPSKNQTKDVSAATGKVEASPNAFEGNGKGKGKAAAAKGDDVMDDDGDDDDDDEDEEDEEFEDEIVEDEMEEDDDDEDELDKIDPSAILPTGRRTRGIRIDYSSKEAQEKLAGDPVISDDEE